MSETTAGRFRAADLLQMSAEEATEAVVEHASSMKASDLFLLMDEGAVTLAMRRLGVVEQIAVVTRDHGRHMLSHIKALSGMDIAEHRRPMDGRWILVLADGNKLDMRINSIPTLYGEDMALRLWDRDQGLRSIDDLGMSRDQLSVFYGMLERPSGLILVTGPTGTGKTTTLYASLQHLNTGKRKINTLEDPIEFALEGVRQAQVNPLLGLDFPELLRSVLRQAPDVIMIGEIRDEGTAVTAVRAANSGHLVLATLHAPVASMALQSMLALDSHPFFLSSCLVGVVAQRLVRKLCPECRVEYDISEAPETFKEIQDLLGPNEGRAIYGPRGCNQCYGSGYSDRVGLFEIMTMNQELRRLLASSQSREAVEKAAKAAGMVEFRRTALLKVAQGLTSTEEIVRDVPAEYLGLED